jgi:hypothetical protein
LLDHGELGGAFALADPLVGFDRRLVACNPLVSVRIAERRMADRQAATIRVNKQKTP